LSFPQGTSLHLIARVISSSSFLHSQNSKKSVWSTIIMKKKNVLI